MSKDTISYLETSLIQPNPYQPRRTFNAKELEELAESIDTQGLLQPITVIELVDETGTHYQLVAGERRLRAVRDILGKPRIKAIITKNITTNQQEELALVENVQRSDLNPMETAIALRAIMEREELTQEQVAKRIGKSRADVSNLLRLLNLPQEVQDMVANTTLERTKAWKLATLPDPKKVVELATKIVEQSWTLEKVKTEVDKISDKRNKAEKKQEGESIKPSSSKPTTIPVDLSKFVLVEFDGPDQLEQFVTYLIEQGFKCHTNKDINRALQPQAIAPKEPEFSGFFEETVSSETSEPLELDA